ncbi:protein BOLA4, chloroplastic/mitochondrial [Malania oleifera]|uniref:protein BOLA4, chloroplastic/mitochondrial n=1 Tax=Malania oleifera TaxID=397392 RepID=UPI0025AE52BA|nr:protein BOLA4, chloroplastic/mitochondrial [Malania oleifera]
MAAAGAALLLRPCAFCTSRTHLFPRALPALRPPSSFFLQRPSSQAKKLKSPIIRLDTFSPDRAKLKGLLALRRTFSTTPSAHVNESGSIDSPLMQSMENKIKEHLQAESVIVKDADAYGDGRHVCIDVVSSAFEGQSAVNRQRMVYKAIWEELQSTVHAVDQMTTKTPSEAAAESVDK